jgi:hypothetical protein
VEFFIFLDAEKPIDAIRLGNEIVDRALAEAGVTDIPTWDDMRAVNTALLPV